MTRALEIIRSIPARDIVGAFAIAIAFCLVATGLAVVL